MAFEPGLTKKRRERLDKVKELYKNPDLTLKNIAEQFGVKVNSISGDIRWLRDQGELTDDDWRPRGRRGSAGKLKNVSIPPTISPANGQIRGESPVEGFDRLEALKILIDFGFGRREIAECLMINVATVSRDFKILTKDQKLPHGNDRKKDNYALCVIKYAQLVSSGVKIGQRIEKDSWLLYVLERHLNMESVKSALYGIERSERVRHGGMCTDAQKPYLKLLRHVFKGKVTFPKVRSHGVFWDEYMKLFASGRVAIPCNKDALMTDATERYISQMPSVTMLPWSKDAAEVIDGVIETLDAKGVETLRNRFGIQCEKKSLRELAADDGVTQQRIQQRVDKYCRVLREPANARILMPFLGFANVRTVLDLQERVDELYAQIRSLREEGSAHVMIYPTLAELLRPLEECFTWSVRVKNRFPDAGIILFGDLIQKTESELKRIPGFGRTCVNEVVECLGKTNFVLATILPDELRIQYEDARAKAVSEVRRAIPEMEVLTAEINTLFDFSSRVRTAFLHRDILLLGDLLPLNSKRMLKWPGFNRDVLFEVIEALKAKGWKLGVQLPRFTRQKYDFERQKKLGSDGAKCEKPISEQDLFIVLETEFRMSAWTGNRLKEADIIFIGDLILRTVDDISALKGVGRTVLLEIEDMLAQRGLALGTVLSQEDKKAFDATRLLLKD